MLIDAREVPSGSVLRVDLCVIGGGAAGVTISRELANTSQTVVVLESGGIEIDERTQALAEGESVGEPYHVPLDASRLRLVGGTTNHWAGVCRPLDAVDFASRPGRPGTEWPISRTELEPWYARAHEVIQISYDYDWRSWQQRFGLTPSVIETDILQTEVVQIALESRSTPRRFGDMYLAELEQAPNIQFCTWANVAELDSDQNGGRVTGVEVATLDGNRWRVEARAFVLAVGGLETPRLLLASGGADSKVLGNNHDLVGRYFMEHIQVLDMASLVVARPLDELLLYTPIVSPAEPGRPEQLVQGELSLTPTAVDQNALLASDIVVVPRDLDPSESGEERTIRPVDVSRLLERVEDEALVVANVLVGAEQRPDPESRVRLSRERDALGMPKLELDWRVGRDDRESVVRSLMLMAMELGRLGIGRLRLAPRGESHSLAISLAGGEGDVPDELLDFPVGGGNHHMGTTRMHDNPRQGVVDSSCRVHGVENLYIASTAVFPTGGSAPPTNTLIALSLRLADHLRRSGLT
jgi:choline dehydrogenase-like flavoprotein